MPLIPSQMRTYALTLAPFSHANGVVTEEQQDATAYFIHASGFHVFVNRGRTIRAIAGHKVIEVHELET